MGGMMYSIMGSTGLVSLGLYHLVCSLYNHLKSPSSYSAKPYHPFPTFSSSSSSSSSSWWRRFLTSSKLQVYLIIIFLIVAIIHQTLDSTYSDPLLKGSSPVHRFSSLQSSAVLLLFLLLSLSLLLLPSLPHDLFFALLSFSFFLQYSASSSASSAQTSLLQSRLDSLSACVSAISSLTALSLAVSPRLHVSDAALGASLVLQGQWTLQSGLSLYVDAFIPDGCHRMLDVVGGVEGSTKCDLQESGLRAVALLNFLFVLHVAFLFLVFMLLYALLSKMMIKRMVGSYDPLPTSVDPPPAIDHIQMKTLSGTQA